jgi:hypothetical protein
MPEEKEKETEVVEPSNPNALEVIFSSKENAIEDRLSDKKVLWKDILSEGRIDIAPVPGAQKRPFIVTADGVSDPTNLKVSMKDLMQSFRDQAFKYVKIPMGHPRKGQDIAALNSGYVEGLRVVKRNGKHYLQGALGFTEPDVAGRVRRGSIPDVSSGILLNYTRKKHEKLFPAALHHVALTGDPIDTDLDAFKRVYASDDEVNLSEDQIDAISVHLDDDTDNDDSNKVEVVWDEQDGANWVRTQLEQALNPDPSSIPTDGRPVIERPIFNVNDVSQAKSLSRVDMYFKGARSSWIIPYTQSNGEVKPAPEFRWTEVKEALVAAGEDFGTNSHGKVKEEINKSLIAMFGEEGKQFKLDEISLNKQVLLRNKENTVFLADFALLSNGKVFLSPSEEWEKKAEVKKDDKKPQAKVINLYDESTPEGRVAAARQRRRTAINS